MIFRGKMEGKQRGASSRTCCTDIAGRKEDPILLYTGAVRGKR